MSTETAELSLPLKIAVPVVDDIFWECRRAAPHPDHYDFPSLALFRHMIQMADGIGIVLAAGTSVPTIHLLRSILESLLSLKYIHLAEYQRRSLCWFCAYIHQEISVKEMIDDRTEAGRSFYETIVQEFKGWRPPRKPSSSDHVVELREHLRQPEFAQVEEEYQRLMQRDRYGRRPNWYKLFSGPRNIYELAEAVGMLAFYKFYYQTWSASVHGSDTSRLLFEEADGSAEFRSLRVLDEVENKAPLTIIFLQVASGLMCKKFLRECDLERLNKNLVSKYGESLRSS